MKLLKKSLPLTLVFCVVLTLFVPFSTFAAVPTPAGQWNFDSSVLTDNSALGWNTPVVSGDSNITTGFLGQKGTAWKITHNKDENIGIKLGELPSSFIGANQITLSAWIKRDEATDGQRNYWVDDWQTVFELHNPNNFDGNHSNGIIICNAKFGDGNDTWNPFTPLLNDNDTTTDEHSLGDGRSNLLDNSFHHMAVVLDFSKTDECKFYFYVDGVLWNSYGEIGTRGAFEASWVGCSSGFPAGTTLYVGSNKDSKRQFNGLIDEVQVYNSALSADQVVELYNSYSIDFNDSLVGLWDFNNATLANSVSGFGWSEPVITSDEEINPITKDHIGKKEEAWRSRKIGVYGDAEQYKSGIDLGTLPPELVGSKTMTISAWIKREDFTDKSSTPEDWQTVFQLYNADANKIIFNARFGDNIAEFAPLIHDNDWLATGKRNSGDYTVSTDAFHHIATVLDFNDTNNCKVLFYVDGVFWYSYGLDNESNILTADKIGCENGFTAGTKLYVASNKNLRRQFNGLIDEVRVYSSALSANEITKLYNSYTPAQVTVADSECQMGSADVFGENNSVALNVAGGVADAVNTSYTMDDTINGVFKNNYMRISGIPSGLYVSGIQTNENTATVSFGGKAVSPLIDDATLGVIVYPSLTTEAGANSEPVSVCIKHDTYDFAALADATMNDENKYTVTLRPGVYEDDSVDVIVAVYDDTKALKDVCIKTYTVTDENIPVLTESLDYTEGDMVRLFVWYDISGAKPVKLFNLN